MEWCVFCFFSDHLRFLIGFLSAFAFFFFFFSFSQLYLSLPTAMGVDECTRHTSREQRRWWVRRGSCKKVIVATASSFFRFWLAYSALPYFALLFCAAFCMALITDWQVRGSGGGVWCCLVFLSEHGVCLVVCVCCFLLPACLLSYLDEVGGRLIAWQMGCFCIRTP
jgi:hypothetical protein